MRIVSEILMEMACAIVPEKRDTYLQVYPIIDSLMDSGRRGASRYNQAQLQEVMTTSDFPFVLGEFVQRQLWPAYQRAGFGFEPIVFNDTLPNFLTVTRYQRQSGLEDLQMVRPKGPVRAGSLLDGVKRTYRVYRWERGFDFEAEAIVNDDLGYFNDFATLMGEAARRSVEKFVSQLYFNTTTIAALLALGALYHTNARLSTNALMAGWAAFSQRLDARSEPIQAEPVHLVIHRGLEPLALQIVRSTQVAELATNAVNVLPPLNVIINPYLTGTAPDLPWSLFSDRDRSGIRPITLARLEGRPGPTILQKAPDTMAFSGFGGTGPLLPGMGDFDSGNIQLKVADVWGGWADATYAGLTDYRGIYYSTGTQS